jgi:dienelactone hydrolase
MLSCAKELRSQYKRVAAIGYCYGAWAVFQLGSKAHSPLLVDCISVAHPSWLTKEEMEGVGVPVQIVAAEIDPAFNPELKAYANSVLPTKGLPYDYQFFPGVVHSFSTRGDPENEREKRSLVRAKNASVNWMKEWLHGD